jgi:hypothetical protein
VEPTRRNVLSLVRVISEPLAQRKNGANTGDRIHMMKQIIISYNLKPEVTPSQFEEWVRTVDKPAIAGLSRVSRFQTFRSEALLMGEGKPSYGYIEIFDITDFAGFTGIDMPSAIVQSVMGAFMGLVDNPQFVIASEVV